MMFDLWPVYSGERDSASWPSCFVYVSHLAFPVIHVKGVWGQTPQARAVLLKPQCSSEDQVRIQPMYVGNYADL